MDPETENSGRAKIAIDGKDRTERLTVPPGMLHAGLVLPKGCELLSGHMQLEVSGKEEKMPITTSCVKGTVAFPGKGINWLVADGGREWMIGAIGIEVKWPEKALNGFRLRIQVFGANAWMPLMPVDRFDAVQGYVKLQITPVRASKIMIEPIRETGTKGVWEPVLVEVQKLELFSSALPCDLKLTLAGEPVLAHDGVLPAGTMLAIDGFPERVNAWIAGHDGTDTVPVTVESAMPAEIFLCFTGMILTRVVRQFTSGSPVADLILDFGKKGRLEIEVGAAARLAGAGFECTANLSSERILFDPEPGRSPLAQLCDSGHSAARSFHALGQKDALAGIDLFLRPAALPVSATVTIYGQKAGQPGQAPRPGATMAATIDEQPGVSRWIPFCLDAPLPLGTDPWWAVLTVEAGEVHWLMDPAPRGENSTEAMYRIGEGPWQPCADGAGRARAVVRGETAPSISFSLARGSCSVSPPLVDGRVQLDQRQRDELNKDPTKKLVLQVESNGKGEIHIRNLNIKWVADETL